MSGHSKFANIKHKKEKNDAAKGKIFTIIGREIAVAVKEGGPDKKGNEFKSFVAGADIAEMVNFTAPEARAFGIKASEPFFKLQNMRQVTIAAVCVLPRWRCRHLSRRCRHFLPWANCMRQRAP